MQSSVQGMVQKNIYSIKRMGKNSLEDKKRDRTTGHKTLLFEQSHTVLILKDVSEFDGKGRKDSARMRA